MPCDKPKPSSVCSLVRSTMKIRGATLHSGRGFYDMEHDVPTASQLFERMEDAIRKWQNLNLVTMVERHQDHITVVLSTELTIHGSYNTVRVTKHNDIIVCM